MARLKQVKGWNEYSKDLKKAGTRWTIRKKSNNPYIYVRDKDTNKENSENTDFVKKYEKHWFPWVFHGF